MVPWNGGTKPRASIYPIANVIACQRRCPIVSDLQRGGTAPGRGPDARPGSQPARSRQTRRGATGRGPATLGYPQSPLAMERPQRNAGVLAGDRGARCSDPRCGRPALARGNGGFGSLYVAIRTDAPSALRSGGEMESPHDAPCFAFDQPLLPLSRKAVPYRETEGVWFRLCGAGRKGRCTGSGTPCVPRMQRSAPDVRRAALLIHGP